MIGTHSRTVNTIATIVALALLTPGAPLAAQTRLSWQETLAAARSEARRADRPILAVVTAGSWCDPCSWLDERILASSEFTDYATRRFVPVRVDDTTDDFLDLPVERLPTIIVLAPDGTELGRIAEPASVAGFVASLEAVVGAADSAAAGDRPSVTPGEDPLDEAMFSVQTVGRLWRDDDGTWITQDAALPPRLEEYERDDAYVYLRDSSSRTDLAIERSPPAEEWSLWRWDRETRAWQRVSRLERIR